MAALLKSEEFWTIVGHARAGSYRFSTRSRQAAATAAQFADERAGAGAIILVNA
jgi:hypothetical protein